MEEWQKPETITLWIFIAAMFLLVLMTFILLLVRLSYKKMLSAKLKEVKIKLDHKKDLLHATIQTQEKERERIAADIHDALIGKLSLLRLQYETQSSKVNAADIIDESIETARRISHDLTPPLLQHISLRGLIEDLIDHWEEKFEIRKTFDVRYEAEYSPEFKIQVLRILQELITNCYKYAEANSLNIHYRAVRENLIIKFEDNGKGFDFKAITKGLGLKNIETRVGYLNGKYKIKSALNQGTRVILAFKND